MTAPQRFVILFQGRTGSSYLTSLLRTYLSVYAVGEELVRFLRMNKLRRIREFYTCDQAKASRACGVKTKLQDIQKPSEFGDLLRDFGVKVILLGRRNKVKQTVSFFTGMRLYEATGDWNVYPRTETVGGKVRAEVHEFDRKLREIETTNGRLGVI